MNYLLMSDIHFNDFSAFATIDASGVNSRLQITINEVVRACIHHVKNGGDRKLVIAGDVFHTRGSVKTSVMNPVRDLFARLKKNGWAIFILSGNHDLESKDSRRLTSAVAALEEYCEEVIYERIVDTDIGLAFVPWVQNIDDLKDEIESITPSLRPSLDLILHAPIDGVIKGLPDHGLSDKCLSDLGFKRVFSGHYHCHKDFGNNVYSIGATTHQTFSDVGSKAGFLSVFDDKVTYVASHAPKFVDIDAGNFDDAALIVDGNYVRCRINVAKNSDVEELREHFEKLGAKGVVINQIKDITATERGEDAAVHSTSLSLETSISNYIKLKGYSVDVERFSMEILNETRAML